MGSKVNTTDAWIGSLYLVSGVRLFLMLLSFLIWFLELPPCIVNRRWFIDPSQHEGEWPLGQGTEAHISASCIISRMVLNGLMYQHRIKYFLLLSRRWDLSRQKKRTALRVREMAEMTYPGSRVQHAYIIHTYICTPRSTHCRIRAGQSFCH